MQMSSEKSPRPTILFVISAPSGAGKSTLVQKLLECDKSLIFSISTTTRQIRSGERDGTDYFFTDRATFLQKVKNGEFMEHAEVHGNLYGTEWKNLRRAKENSSDLLLDIDVQGGGQIRVLIKEKKIPNDLKFVIPVLIFIMPPSLSALESRLKNRHTDSDEIIARRLKNAEAEIIKGKNYDHIVINNEIDDAVKKLREIVELERERAAVRMVLQ